MIGRLTTRERDPDLSFSNAARVVGSSHAPVFLVERVLFFLVVDFLGAADLAGPAVFVRGFVGAVAASWVLRACFFSGVQVV
jgi:hypothetical protein